MALSPNQKILCFDGSIAGDLATSFVAGLEENGLFVVRSLEGVGATALALANVLLQRRATVVIYDYCLSACASYFVFASVRTYVLKGALAAWHDGGSGFLDCLSSSPSYYGAGRCATPSARAVRLDYFRRKSLDSDAERRCRTVFLPPIHDDHRCVTVRLRPVFKDEFRLRTFLCNGTGPQIDGAWLARAGISRAVSTDVADTIEGLMPSLMDIFAGSDEVVRFEPVGPEDEAGSKLRKRPSRSIAAKK